MLLSAHTLSCLFGVRWVRVSLNSGDGDECDNDDIGRSVGACTVHGHRRLGRSQVSIIRYGIE